MGSGGISSSKN